MGYFYLVWSKKTKEEKSTLVLIRNRKYDCIYNFKNLLARNEGYEFWAKDQPKTSVDLLQSFDDHDEIFNSGELIYSIERWEDRSYVPSDSDKKDITRQIYEEMLDECNKRN